MDKLEIYLNAINDFNNSFDTYVSNYFMILTINKKDVNSEDELLNNIYKIENEEDKHNAVLIDIKGFEFPLKNFIQNNMYSGFSSFINDNVQNKGDKKKVFKTLRLSRNINYYDNCIQNLEKNKVYYNDVSTNFFDMFIDYLGIPNKTFFIKSNPTFYYACFSEELVFEYEDKYILLGFYIDD